VHEVGKNPAQPAHPSFPAPARGFFDDFSGLVVQREACTTRTISGGSHAAAAFDVPSLVIAWRPLLDRLRFPVSGLGVVAAFLYPQHWFAAADDLTADHFREARLRDPLRDMSRHGRSGRPTDIANHRHSPCGFTPAVLRRGVREGGRFRALPGRAAQPQAAG